MLMRADEAAMLHQGDLETALFWPSATGQFGCLIILFRDANDATERYTLEYIPGSQ